ncbi:DUF6249 domain-containing protein [Xanthocytophaga agilis]|uniref:DUF6249 domain-containing protein n=1 Tax=Xanthocytophaga agilis TaxID=3048010 RepID=A0AAE3UE20_9BACT|nr:DUF6249 domain-containing protein [Xanthocytophaga agilis]MDJ1499802.1 hypothetical protein [Xanthocytophaga agilis]
MGPDVAVFMVPIVSVIGIITMIIFIRYYMNVERMALIQKGIDPFTNKPKGQLNPSVTLRIALLLIGTGVGILLGNFLDEITPLVSQAAYFSMILIFGGAGLLTSYAFELRMAKREEAEAKKEIKYENI